MQVYFNNFSNIPYQNFRGMNKNVTTSVLPDGNSVENPGRGEDFGEEYIAHTDIKKITSEEEFDRVLNKMKNDRSWLGGWWNRETATKFEQAIIPYSGEEARNAHINCYMRNGHLTDPSFSEDITRDYIRAMYYALPEIDKKYGKYRGIVFRFNRMDKVPKNFVSTARDPMGVSYLITSREDYHKPFYIIYTRHGHRLEEIQKRYCQKYAKETEILLDPGSHYEEITEITPQMEELKRILREAIRDEYPVPELNIIFLKEIPNRMRHKRLRKDSKFDEIPRFFKPDRCMRTRI